jgi:hypothetical protein
MRSLTKPLFGLLAASTLLLVPAAADHIPGHDPDANVFPVPLPGSDVFTGGAVWLHGIGPEDGAQVHRTGLDVTYVSDGVTPASELLLNIGWTVELAGGEAQYVEVLVTGADLGFGSGPGTFRGTYETMALNGTAIEYFLTAPYSSVDIIIGAVNGGIEGTGYFVDSFIEFHLAPAATPSFCDDGDGALATCPCANPGAPDTGCDIQQGTGGVGLDLLSQETTPQNRVTWSGTGFPTTSTPASVVIRANELDPGAPVVFGDGLRCIGTPVVRLGAAFAVGGTATFTHGHGSMAGAGTFYYQLWFRNSPVMYCDPTAAFNLSNGRMLTW